MKAMKRSLKKIAGLGGAIVESVIHVYIFRTSGVSSTNFKSVLTF